MPAHCPLLLQGPSFDPMLHELQCLPMSFDGNILEEVAEARTGVLEVCFAQRRCYWLDCPAESVDVLKSWRAVCKYPCCHDGLQL